MLSILLCLLLVVATHLRLVLADRPAFLPQDAERYDRGLYGRAPIERLHSTDVPAIRLLKRTWDEEQCASDDSHYLIATRGREAKAGIKPHAGPIIMNKDGLQVWFGEGYEPMYNFRSQMYKGQRVLTFWAGKEMRGGHGEGYYYMLDKHYNEIMRIDAHGNYSADLHEFKITENQETALLTSYPRSTWPYDKWPTTQNETDIWDNVFQEINLETGELLFEWKASDHFTPDDCFNPKPARSRPVSARPPARPPATNRPTTNINHAAQAANSRLSSGVRPPTSEPWDWFHINSLDKDAKGNYLMSSRYSHSVSYVSSETGQILWQLGGKNNSFQDLSNGSATSLAWQHHASWQDDYTAITIFDNEAVSFSANRKSPTEITPSRGLKIRIDQEAMTAEVAMQAIHPQRYSTQSQGSIQQLPNGNFFVGYGNTAAMTEYSPEGKVICDFQFGALHYRTSTVLSPGGIQSYRAFKVTRWQGFPLTTPKIAFASHYFYVSWNGATEVRRWVLEGKKGGGGGGGGGVVGGSGSEGAGSALNLGARVMGKIRPSSWVPVGETKWTGFESEISVPNTHRWGAYRLTAVDGAGKPLGKWTVLGNGSVELIPTTNLSLQSLPTLSLSHPLTPSLLLLLALSLTLLALLLHRFRSRALNLFSSLSLPFCLSSPKNTKTKTKTETFTPSRTMGTSWLRRLQAVGVKALLSVIYGVFGRGVSGRGRDSRRREAGRDEEAVAGEKEY